MSERYRRAPTIALFWEAGVLAGGNFFEGTFDRLDPRDAAVLDALGDWRTLVVFLTAVVKRLSFKYKHGRAYRVLLFDQGHVSQSFVLTATALGLGAWQTAAFRDGEVEEALGVDGIEEVALYALGAGVTPIPPLYPMKTIELHGGPPKRLEFPPP